MSYAPVSSRWAGALAAKPFTPYTFIDVYASRTATTPMNTSPLLVTAGSCSWDTTANIRRTASQVTFVNQPGLPLVPNQAGDVFFPSGTEFVINKGFWYPDGTNETVPQGRLLMDDAVTLDAGGSDSYNLTIAIDGSDRMEEVQRNEFSQAYTSVPTAYLQATIASSGACYVSPQLPLTAPAPPFIISLTPYAVFYASGPTTPATEQMLVTAVDSGGGMTVTAGNRGYNGTTPQAYAVNDIISETADVTCAGLIQSRVPGVPMNVTPSTFTLAPAAYAVGDDPSAFIAAQALAAGCEQYFDRTGTWVFTPIVDPATLSVDPNCNMVEGQRGTTFTQLQRTLSNQGVPNWIIVISQGSNIPTPLRADWQDTNPNSYTYIDGNYPTTIEVVQTSSATTQAQAQAMANALGLTAQGLFDAMQVTFLGDPAIGDGDVISLTRSASRMSGAPYCVQQGQLYLDTSNNSTLTGYRVIPGT
jgi:hypothetical protein